MENTILPSGIIFLDIETVAAYSCLEKAPEHEQFLWKIKENQLKLRNPDDEISYAKAGIFAEFGKIICISCGILSKEADSNLLTIYSFTSKHEKHLLEEFLIFLDTQKTNVCFCAHNGKEFDFPYLSRRILINGLRLPKQLQIAGKKPWEIKHLDTLELWKFGDYKHYTSLELLSHVFKLPSPKNELDGSMVYEYFYKKRDLKSIRNYCENDVLTLVCVYLQMTGKPEWIPKHVEVERMQ